MKPRKCFKGEKLFIFLFAAISVVAFVLSIQLFQKDSSLSGAGIFPLCAAVILVISAGFMIWEMRKCESAFEAGTSLLQKGKETLQYLFPDKLSIVIAYVIAYGVLMVVIGFNPATFLFLAATMITLSEDRSLKGIGKDLIYSAILLAFIWFVFQYVFRVVLP